MKKQQNQTSIHCEVPVEFAKVMTLSAISHSLCSAADALCCMCQLKNECKERYQHPNSNEAFFITSSSYRTITGKEGCALRQSFFGELWKIWDNDILTDKFFEFSSKDTIANLETEISIISSIIEDTE